MSSLPDPLVHRVSEHPVESLFLRRWSPRAMNGEPVAQSLLLRLLEAARWAPSTFNVQEARFLYAHRDGEHWSRFYDLLVEGNQSWCKDAGVLVLVASKSTFEGNGSKNPVHEFDAGLATQNLLLQGAAMGLVTHPMAGFDRGAAVRELGLPADVKPAAMVAIGHPGDPASLPEDIRDDDRRPTGRKPVDELYCEGPYKLA